MTPTRDDRLPYKETTEPPQAQVEQVRYCTHCGYQNPNDVELCLNCSTPFGIVCPTCRQVVAAGSKFCVQCGHRLAGQPVIDSSPPPRQRQNQLPVALMEKFNRASGKSLGEHRVVTILFLRLTDFVVGRQPLDEADIYRFIDEALSRASEVVYTYEGTIDKFTNNGLMALFGVPIAHENDPERAVRAALTMMTTIAPLQKRIKESYDFDFQVKIGLNTGPVVAGKVGNDLHLEYTVIGQAVNLAARLEELAEAGTIAVSQETYRRTRSLFAFKTQPPITVKGLPDPVEVFQPVGLRQVPELYHGQVRFKVTMVGRAEELALLQRALEQVQQQGRRHLVLLRGQAGVGKSRLIKEFCQPLPAGQINIFQGDCLSYARSTPLRVVAELLRDLLHLSEQEPPQRQVQAIESYLRRQNLVVAEVAPYLHHILALPQPDREVEARLQSLDAATLQQQTHLALRQVILVEAMGKPTILIFENMHRVDSASKDFLAYLMRTASEAPLLIVLVSRQAEHEAISQTWLEMAGPDEPERWTDLTLPPLSPTQGQFLVDQLIAQSTSDAWLVKKMMVERAAGNPFYVEEMMRMLVDQGGLIAASGPEQKAQVTTLAKDLLQKVPDTIRGLILARFDRLPRTLQQILYNASVLGNVFPCSLLQQLSEIPATTLKIELRELEKRHFLLGQLFQGEPGCLFQHTLVQEAIYGTLLKRDQRRIHTQAAQAIETSSQWRAEDRAEALAFHYARSTTPLQAIPYLVQAAQNAERRCAYESAIEHYRHIITISPDWPGRQNEQFFQIRLGLGRSLKYVGEYAAAEEILAKIQDPIWGLAVESETFRPLLIETLGQLSDLQHRQSNYEKALIYLEAGLKLLDQKAAQEDLRLWQAIVERVAWIRFRQGQLEEGFALADHAAATISSHEPDDPVTLARLYNTLGLISWQQGRLDAAILAAERSRQFSESIGYTWGIAIAYGNLGIYFFAQGEWDQASTYLDRAYELHQATGDRQNQVYNLVNLGVLKMNAGKHEQAKRELEASLWMSQQLGDVWGAVHSQLNLAQLALIQGRLAEGTNLVETALTLADKIKSIEIQVEARWILALIQAEQGQLVAGLQSAQQAIAMAQTAGLTEQMIDCLRALGILYTKTIDYKEARKYLQQSLDLALKKNDPYRYGKALLAFSTLYYQQCQNDTTNYEHWLATSKAFLSEATEKFVALGAAHDIHLAQLMLEQIQMG